jgi:two-component system, HptB-dependent secretion and biofilm response regulator
VFALKILVVDDNPSNRKILRGVLVHNNHQVIEAESGEAAIICFSEEQPDLVLMDIMMPGMDGRECASHIKSLAGEIYTPIIYVTALDANIALPSALAAGGDDYVTKPINFEVLNSKIAVHQRIRELHRELAEKNRQLALHNLRLEREQELTSHFFDTALRQSYLDPDILRHHISAAAIFNGDMLLVERGPSGGLYILVGDFTGHGLGAAIGTLPVAQIFFSMAKQGAWLGEIARAINDALRAFLPRDMFLSAGLFELAANGKLISIWNGGMPPSYVLNPHTGLLRKLESQHVPLGILPDTQFNTATQVFEVSLGERMYQFTNGLYEATNNTGDMFGDTRLPHLLANAKANLFDAIITELASFNANAVHADDTTFIELTCRAIAPSHQADMATTGSRASQPNVAFELSILLGPAELRNLNSVSPLVEQICATIPLTYHRSMIHTILAELYANALEHGILELPSLLKTDADGFDQYYILRGTRLAELTEGEIRLNIRFEPVANAGLLHIQLQHGGNGFDVKSLTTQPEMAYGRGLLLLKGLCQHLEFNADGTGVDLIYNLGNSINS